MKKKNYISNNNAVRTKVVNKIPAKSDTVNTNDEAQEQKEIKSQPRVYKFPKLVFLCKVLVILGIVFAAVRYTDKKNIFEPDKSFRETYLRSSFDELAKKDTIDICLFGNSHIGHAISTNVLSNALGVTCFNFYQSGSDLQDVYFCMKNVLQNIPVKVAVIETYVMTNVIDIADEEAESGGKFKVGKIRDWDDNIKFEAMFEAYEVEQYPYLWSTTLRNHDFIFRDTAQIRKNKDPKYKKYESPKKTFLGSSGLTVPGISDSLDKVYDELGPKADGSVIGYSAYDKKYIKKISDLCAEYNTQIMFVTIPEYYKNVKNYDQWHDLVADLIAPTNAPWFDMQLNYDSVLIRRDFFENKRVFNQHVVNAGMNYFSVRLAQFINDSCSFNLPDRTQEKRWKEIFYETEGYFLFNSPNSTDTLRVNVCEEKTFGDKVVKNAFIVKGEKNNDFYLKLKKSCLKPEEISKNLNVKIEGRLNGRPIITEIEMFHIVDVLPVKTNLYRITLIKEFELTGILDIALK